MINDKKLERNAKRENIEAFLRTLKKGHTLLTEFDEELWNVAIEAVTVYQQLKLCFMGHQYRIQQIKNLTKDLNLQFIINSKP